VLLVFGASLSIRFDHCFCFHIFYLLATILTFVVYIPTVQKNIYFFYGEHSLRLLGWNSSKAFIKLGTTPAVKAIVVVGTSGLVAELYCHEELIRRRKQANVLYQEDIALYKKISKEFPHIRFSVPEKIVVRKPTPFKDILEVVGIKIEPQQRPQKPGWFGKK